MTKSESQIQLVAHETARFRRLLTLFDGVPYLPVVLAAARHHHGELWSTVAGPAAVRLDIGCYRFFAGDADNPAVAALMTGTRLPAEFLFPTEDDRWRARTFDVFGDSVRDRPMRSFDSSSLDVLQLKRNLSTGPGFQLKEMTPDEALQLDQELEPHGRQVVPDANSFIESGVGFCILRQGRVIAAATSYARSDFGIEVSIACRPAYRRLGLATIASSRLLIWCLTRGLRPDWHAANPISKRLALRVGYRLGPMVPVLYIRE